ncbi:hypothetical protein J3458_002708 [Metarhizium acridum]|uniref:uncharacterized protein n=1 Tax=Metarhizium acridum TaxID=92637 RepID=UPI001C6C4A67|nr:hypothetical protein J3458_002708 [Metarhizium acridum]
MTKKFLHAQWRENIKGNHEGNLEALHEDIKAVNPVLNKPLTDLKKMKRQSSLCDWENPFEADKEPNGDEGSNTPKGEQEPKKPKGEATPEETERQTRCKRVNKDLTTFRKDFLKYEALEATSPRLHPGSGGVALKVAGVAGSALWVGEVVHAFTTDMGLMDRATIMTSIIPFVDCVMNALDGIVKDRNEIFNGIDSTLCLIGDAFAMGGFIPGVVIVVGRV